MILHYRTRSLSHAYMHGFAGEGEGVALLTVDVHRCFAMVVTMHIVPHWMTAWEVSALRWMRQG